MQNNMMIFKEKFEEIKKMGWVRVTKGGYGGVGMLFENEMGICNNDFPVADFNGIELKVHGRNSKHPLTLFSCTCDGPGFFEMKRIVQKYGISDYDFGGTKLLYITLACDGFAAWGRFLKMKLYVDYRRERVYILICHINGKVIEKKAYWSFETLRQIVDRKLRYLCYVTYSSRMVGGIPYARYEEMHFYKIKGFEIFMSLLVAGEIVVNIKSGVYKKGPKAGRPYDHGTGFQIKEEAIEKLYDEVLF